MSERTAQMAEMFDMLPEQDQVLAYELIKKMVLAWDPEFTKLTEMEKRQMENAEQSGFVSEEDIDWNKIGV